MPRAGYNVDWTAPMQQTFEFYIVDPGTWKDVKKLTMIESCTIDRDSESTTLGSAMIDSGEPIGEAYVRVYLKIIQNGVETKHPLATVLVQTPSDQFDGKSKTYSMDAYTPLLELNEKYPDIGYFIPKGENIMDQVYKRLTEQMRAPVIPTTCAETLDDNFITDPTDTWLTTLIDLAAGAEYKFALDEMGQVLLVPKQKTAALQPVWTYTDDDSSILYSDVGKEQDLYGIPNVVEVVCSTNEGILISVVKNEDAGSPTSIQSRGREIKYRETSPSIMGAITQERLDDYAEQLLKELSSVEYTITYSHGYCPVNIGDCVRLNYKRAGLNGVKARVITQSIECTPGCKVTETAVYTEKLWR